MEKPQNIYDNPVFFEDYQTMRESKINANELIEIPQIKKMLPNIKGKTILDLGCGAGGMSRFFAENGAKKVVGIDISSNMLKIAKERTLQKNISYLNLPMEDISSLNSKFEFVFSSLAFHYVENFDKLISDISKLLKPNGVLLFSQEHPVGTAMIFNSPNMENHIEINGKRYYLLSDYNNNSQRKLHWSVDDVVKYHRNFSTIINSLINNGLEILQIEESTASEEAIKLVPKYKYQNDRPYFLFVKAIKKSN